MTSHLSNNRAHRHPSDGRVRPVVGMPEGFAPKTSLILLLRRTGSTPFNRGRRVWHLKNQGSSGILHGKASTSRRVEYRDEPDDTILPQPGVSGKSLTRSGQHYHP